LFALTFDDGPSEWTEAILDSLACHGAAATFFVIGSAIKDAKHEETLRRILAQGCEIGNHTCLHLPLHEMRASDVRDELERTSSAIERAVGAAPRYWRAPFLQSSAEAACAAAELGLREVGASLVAADYAWTSDETATFVLERLEPGDIVDLHDGRPPFEPEALSRPTRGEVVVAVDRILREAVRRKLRSVTVTELLATGLGSEAQPP
jgi:peptidoglycan/xylan/chitin deacetylase (PgdA/CDA1 family)